MADSNQQPELAVVAPSETLEPLLASSQAPVVPPLAGPAPVAFWCYSCRLEVSLTPAAETVCPTCGSGFLEEMSTADAVGALRQQRRRVHSNPSRRFRLGLSGLPTPRLVRILELLHAGDVLSGEAAPTSEGAAATAEVGPAAEVRSATPVPDVSDVPDVPSVPAVRRPRERTRRRDLGGPGFTDVTVQVVHRWDGDGSQERRREEQAMGSVESGSMAAAEEMNHGSRQVEDQGRAAPEPLLQPSSGNSGEDVGRTDTPMEGIDIAVGVPARITANGRVINSDDEDEEMEDLEGFEGMDHMDADDDEGWDEYSYSNFQIAGTMDGDDDDDDDEDDDEDDEEDDDEDEDVDVDYGQDAENENERAGASNGTREQGVAGLTSWLLGEENAQRQQGDENNSTPLRTPGPSGVTEERAREEGQTPSGTAEPQRRHRRRRTSQMREHVAVYVQSLLERNIEFHFQLPAFIGNPGDYLDSRGYEQLLNELAENDNSRRGAPPASKTVVDSLPTVQITEKQVQQGLAQCAVCKDDVKVGESATQLPCSHMYHSDCIVPWLSSRNSCPICRFELKTDDADYEEQRSRRRSVTDVQGRGWGLGANEQVSQVAAAGSAQQQDEPNLAQRNSNSYI